MRKLFAAALLSVVYVCMGLTIDAERPPKVVVADNAVPSVKLAAQELADFIGRSLGAKVEQGNAGDGGVRIFVGVGPDGRRVTEATYDSHIVIRGNTIYIYGYDTAEGRVNDVSSICASAKSRGTLEAAYSFLEDYFGIRWLEPGKAGEIVPGRKSLELPEMERTLSPSFNERRIYYLMMIAYRAAAMAHDGEEYGTAEDFAKWTMRLRLTYNSAPVNGCHTPHILALDKVLFPNHPEMFALQADGFRNWRDLCWSCQETKNFWWELVDAYFDGKELPYNVKLRWKPWNDNEFMIDPHDYGKDYFCKCPTCQAFLEKYGDNGTGECIFQTIAEVARKVEAKHPGKNITTLVYPPKKMYPESVKLPKNLRVRMTVSDQAICSNPIVYEKELALMRRWKEQQGNKIRLWMYILFDFGARLHDVPEFASTNFINFLKKAAPYSEGVFYEHIEASHTMRNVDIYLIAHALWNIDMDIDATRNEFFKLGYGAAANDMLAFYNRVEHNSDEVMKLMIAHPEECPHAVAHKLRKRVFNTIYTYEELETLQKMLDAARAKLPHGSELAKRINHYEKHVMAPAREGFSVYSDDKVHAIKKQIPLYCLQAAGEPTEKEWDEAPWIEMVSAKPGAKVSVRSQVKVLSSAKAFHVRARFEEPLIAQSHTTDDGDKKANIWDDNEAELFFASERTGKVVQIGINDKGLAAVHDVESHKFRMAGKEVKVNATRESGAWTFTASIDNTLTGFSPDAIKDSFNMTRGRNVAKLPSEYHTLSSECILGQWTIPAFYTVVLRTVRKPVETQFKGRGLPVSDGKTTVLVEDAVETVSGWSKWVTPPARAEFGRDNNVKYGKAPSYFMDMTAQNLSDKNAGTSWRFNWELPPKGSRIRATAWVLARTTYPDPGVSLSVNWLNERSLWYTKVDYSGGVTVPVKPNEWQKVSMEIVVPDNGEIMALSPIIGGVRMATGKLWIGSVKLELVEK